MEQPQQHLEQQRQKCWQRLGAPHALRYATLAELAGLEAQLQRPEEALSALREAVASGYEDVAALDDESGPFAALQTLPAFVALVDALCGRPVNLNEFVYAQGEVARCAAEGLLCIVCARPLREPLVVHAHPCGEVFCAACVVSSTTLTSCPHCEHPISEATLVQCAPRRYVQQLSALKCHCPRCQRIVERGALPAHLAHCPVGPSPSSHVS